MGTLYGSEDEGCARITKESYTVRSIQKSRENYCGWLDGRQIADVSDSGNGNITRISQGTQDQGDGGGRRKRKQPPKNPTLRVTVVLVPNHLVSRVVVRTVYRHRLRAKSVQVLRWKQ